MARNQIERAVTQWVHVGLAAGCTVENETWLNRCFMSIIDPRSPSPIGMPGVDAFARGAQESDELRVAVDGDTFKVLGQGQFAGAGGTARSVAWVQGETDTTQMFVQALAQSYGAGLSSAVARELGLDPAPGKPLASRLVQHAIDAAQTGQNALAGVDFLTFLEHSAVAGGAGFRQAAAAAGIDPAALEGSVRGDIDQRLRERMAQAAASGHSPIASGTMAEWLGVEFNQLTKRPT